MWAYIANSFVFMCGIAGIISTQKDFVQQSHLQKMADALAHRGPNAEGFWINEHQPIGFAHRRLSIIDLNTNANQPFQLPTLFYSLQWRNL